MRVRVWGRQDKGEVEPCLAHRSSHCKHLCTKPTVQFSLRSRVCGMGALNTHSSCKCGRTASLITEEFKYGFWPLLKESVKWFQYTVKKKIIKCSENNTLVCKWLGLERQGGGLYSGHTFSIGWINTECSHACFFKKAMIKELLSSLVIFNSGIFI